jgi:hypothetical protein
MSVTVCLSGPARTRAHAQLALLEAGYPPVTKDHPQAHALMDWESKLPQLPSGKEPKAPHEFLTVIAEDVNEPVDLVAEHKWVLRREIAELKAKVG